MQTCRFFVLVHYIMLSVILNFANAQMPSHGPESHDNRIDLIRPDAPALSPYGGYDIGVMTLELIHEDQLDILNATANTTPRYDRPLKLEIWYPAVKEQGDGVRYQVITRDGHLEVSLWGRAVRDAVALPAQFPLIIISHGYPGNRFLLSHLGENLASKGYITVSIDHTDSTYSDQAAFGSTLLNRSLDQLFVLNELARLSEDESSPLAGRIDTDRTGIIGYSMGAYGAVNTIGGGVSAASVAFPWAVPNGELAQRQAGDERYLASLDDRIKAVIAIAPWGMTVGFWDAEGLAGIKTPIMYVAGSVDDVSGYEKGVKAMYEATVNAKRYLLTFENANHNAGAPMPAPLETWQPSEHLSFVPFDHYADAVWDNVRMNNIMQHFATAFFGLYLSEDDSMADYLDLVENAKDGVWSVEDDGTLKEDHSYWQGFPNRTAVGLSLRQAEPTED